MSSSLSESIKEPFIEISQADPNNYGPLAEIFAVIWDLLGGSPREQGFLLRIDCLPLCAQFRILDRSTFG